MSVTRFRGSIFTVENAPDSRTSCRSCGERIMAGEPRVMWIVAGWGRYPSRRGAHVECWLDESGGEEFIRRLMGFIGDEQLRAMGFEVDAVDEFHGLNAEDVALEVGDILIPRVERCCHGGIYIQGGEYDVQAVHRDGELIVGRPNGSTWMACATDFTFGRRPR